MKRLTNPRPDSQSQTELSEQVMDTSRLTKRSEEFYLDPRSTVSPTASTFIETDSRRQLYAAGRRIDAVIPTYVAARTVGVGRHAGGGRVAECGR